MQSKNKAFSLICGLMLGVAATLLAAAISLAVIHITGFPYCFFANPCADETGMALDEVWQNYNAVMHYLSPFFNGEFSLPTLAFSAGGAQHFADCKPIFNAVYILGALSGILWAAAIARRKLLCRVLTVSGITTLVLPAAIGIGCAMDFDKAFELFHKIFFSNDLWLFDPDTDPVINILPQDFFLACAVFTAILIAMAAVAQLAAARLIERKA